jgi:hypothetical protein
MMNFQSNQPRNTRRIELDNSTRTIRDRIDNSDRQDTIRFTLRSPNTFTARLNRLQTNADLVLLDAQRKVLQRSARKGKQAESIQQPLASGTYYLQVVPHQRSANTRYRLVMTATTNAAGQPVAAKPLPSNRGFNIQFDYSFDTDGWFTPDRRAALEAAGAVWEQIILDDFPDIAPGRVTRVLNPQTGKIQSYTSKGVDDLVIVVGTRKRSGLFTTLATAPADWLPEQSHSDFAPWVSTITFNPTINWFFDPTPNTATDIPSNQDDFISTAVHEMGHVLGISRSKAFEQLSPRYQFQGAITKARNGGNPIELTNTWHFDQASQPDGSGDPLMSTFMRPGQRKLPTPLDVAVLDDTGYTVNYGATFRNPVI